MKMFRVFSLAISALWAACLPVDGGKPDNDEASAPVDVANSGTAVDAAAPALRAASCPAPTRIAAGNASLEVPILGDSGSTMGVFDPSVIYPAGAPGGAMAYTSVPNQHALRTRIALSNTNGALWIMVAEANAPELALIPSSDPAECPGGFCLGFLISEVPSLVYDASDPNAAARWKLFAHRYLAESNDRLHYTLGTITVQTAPEPHGPWTPPRKLFGVPSSSPYTLEGAQVNAATFPPMADCVALTEPSALWLPDRLDLAMGCVYPANGTFKIRIVLARTTDHGRTWTGVARMLEAGDADCLPGTIAGSSVNAPNLFLGPDGREYLSATSSDPGYHGCAIYRVDSPLTGHIERLPSGAPRVLRVIAADTGQFSGACTWSAAGGGYFMDVGFLGAARPFRIYRAGAVAP
jgi:hypothetical protein